MHMSPGQSFDPEELAQLSRAFERSISAIEAPRSSDPARLRYHRETIARSILGAAAAGERDWRKLAAAAVARMNVE